MLQTTDVIEENYLNFTYSKNQLSALEKLDNFINSESTFFLLAGYAGTGKSTVIFTFIKRLIQARKRVVVTAPTNKAVNVLKKIAVNNGLPYLDHQTTHQLLGLSLVEYKDKQILKQVNPSGIYLYDIFIIDECSMIGQELWNLIQQEFNSSSLIKSHKKVILMGDPAQLYPVGEGMSLTFKVTNRIVIREVVRQKNDSPLMDFINSTRKAIKNPRKVFVPQQSYYKNKIESGAFCLKESELISYAIDAINQNFADNPDFFRILAFTNKKVNYYNDVIRQAVYGLNSPRFIVGERLITKKPVMKLQESHNSTFFNSKSKQILINNSCEITVKEIEEVNYYNYLCYHLIVAEDNGMEQEIFVLHESEQNRFSAELEQKLKLALKNPLYWRTYYNFRDKLFAQVTSCFALTVHFSQGSTFVEGGIDSNDLAKRLSVGNELKLSQNLKEYHRLWYVAASRFQTRLFFTHLKNKK
jgi:exodeoxyribonuclease-5